jgi:hypothetical protein
MLRRNSQPGRALTRSGVWAAALHVEQAIDDSLFNWREFGSLDSHGADFHNPRNARSVSAGDLPLRLVISPIYD